MNRACNCTHLCIGIVYTHVCMYVIAWNCIILHKQSPHISFLKGAECSTWITEHMNAKNVICLRLCNFTKHQSGRDLKLEKWNLAWWWRILCFFSRWSQTYWAVICSALPKAHAYLYGWLQSLPKRIIFDATNSAACAGWLLLHGVLRQSRGILLRCSSIVVCWVWIVALCRRSRLLLIRIRWCLRCFDHPTKNKSKREWQKCSDGLVKKTNVRAVDVEKKLNLKSWAWIYLPIRRRGWWSWCCCLCSSAAQLYTLMHCLLRYQVDNFITLLSEKKGSEKAWHKLEYGIRCSWASPGHFWGLNAHIWYRIVGGHAKSYKKAWEGNILSWDVWSIRFKNIFIVVCV